MDHRRIKERIRQQWDEVATRWHRWAPVIREQFEPASELMLDLAHLQPGDHVLDVAAGDGYQSIAAARRVGSRGFVLAVDLSPEQVRHITEAAAQARTKHVETRVMDGENLDVADGSFDAVLCHLGLMWFPDPDRGIREMLRVLKPRGRASLVLFAEGGTPESDLASATIRGWVSSGAGGPDRPSAESLGAPGVLERKLKAAGFRDVESHRLSVPLRLESATVAARYLRDVHPAWEEAVASVAAGDREELWREVEDALAIFDGPDGFESPNEVLVVAGARAGKRTRR